MLLPFPYLVDKYNVHPDVILHLGANAGQEAEAYYNAGVESVIWVEAIPAVFEKLNENVKDFHGTITINACVSDVDGEEVEFNVSNNESQSSSFLQLDHHKIIHPEVHYVDKIKMATHRVDTLLKNFKVEGKWFLNADLQGAELLALKGMGNLLHKFKWLYLEVNKKNTYDGCPLVEDIDHYVSKYGFVRSETAEWVADSWTDAFYVKHEN